MITIKHPNQKTPIRYAMIEPVKIGGHTTPNYMELDRVMRNQLVNITHSQFAEAQERGETILINQAGGWCFLTKDDEILTNNIWQS